MPAWRRLTLLVFSLAGIGQVIGLVLAISFFLGEMSAVMVVLPTLVFMLTLSAAIHLVNYHRDAGGLSVALAGARAVQLGAWPCGLATLTTVFGFASLIVSQLSPVWQFGALAALGLLASTGLLLSVFPAATELAAAGFRAQGRCRPTASWPGQFDPDAALQMSRVPSQPQWPLMLARFTERWTWPICILGVLLLALSAAGITRLRPSTEFVDMFPSDSRSIRNLNWIVEHIGPVGTLEVLLSFPATTSAGVVDRLETTRQVAENLQSMGTVHSTFSAASLLPNLSHSRGTRSVIARAVFRRKLETNYGRLIDQELLARNGPQELSHGALRIHRYAPAAITLQRYRTRCDSAWKIRCNRLLVKKVANRPAFESAVCVPSSKVRTRLC